MPTASSLDGIFRSIYGSGIIMLPHTDCTAGCTSYRALPRIVLEFCSTGCIRIPRYTEMFGIGNRRWNVKFRGRLHQPNREVISAFIGNRFHCFDCLPFSYWVSCIPPWYARDVKRTVFVRACLLVLRWCCFLGRFLGLGGIA